MLKYVQAAAVGCGLIVSVAYGHTNPEAKISARVQLELASEQAIPAIVLMKEKADLTPAAHLQSKAEKGRFVYDALRHVAADSQAGLVAFLKERGIKHHSYYITNMVAVFDADAKLIQEIAARSDVEKIVGNVTFNSLPPVTFTAMTPWSQQSLLAVGPNISSTGADRAWTELNARGQGMVVASQDTGVQWDHPGLRRQYRGNNVDGTSTHNYHWHDAIRERIGSGKNRCGYATEAPCDDHGHGTHTVGTMIGDDDVGNQVGMAPNAQWIGCRNMDAGIGRPTTYIECFEFFLAPYPHGGNALTDGNPDMAPHVINNSWGCPRSEGCQADEIRPVLQALDAAGIAVVAAAGNEGSACQTITDAPAMHSDLTVSVGAHDYRNGNIASFSSRGPSKFDGKIGPDVTAPGVSIRSTVPGGGYSASMWSGTSMAAPHVAGLVALMWSANPQLVGDMATTTAMITSTATAKTSTQTCGGTAGSAIPNNTFGHGLINAYEAVKAATNTGNDAL